MCLLSWNLLIIRTLSGPAVLSGCPLSEVIFYRVCIQEYFQLVLCWEACPLSECPFIGAFSHLLVHVVGHCEAVVDSRETDTEGTTNECGVHKVNTWLLYRLVLIIREAFHHFKLIIRSCGSTVVFIIGSHLTYYFSGDEIFLAKPL